MKEAINPEFAGVVRQLENLHPMMLAISSNIQQMTGHVLIADIVKALVIIKDISNASKGIEDRFTMLLIDAFRQKDQEVNRLTRELELFKKIFPDQNR